MAKQVLNKNRTIFLLSLLYFFEELYSFAEVHRSTVIGIHQAKIPEFCSLIEIRDSRRSDLKNRLRERIQHARISDPPVELRKVAQKTVLRAGNKDILHKLAHSVIVSLVWINPAC